MPSYRGDFEIHKTEDGLLLINELLLEEYLYAVVPSEMPSTYPSESLKAQAVCARTYSYGYLEHAGLPALGAHVDDSVNYQVYNNIMEKKSSTDAVRQTEGELLLQDGKPITAYYYSTSCGYGTDDRIWKEEGEDAVENFLVTKKRRSIHSHVLTAINNPSAIFHHFLTFPYSLFSFPVEFVSPVLFFLSQTAFPVFSLLPSPSDTVPLIPDTLPTVQSCPP